MEKEDYKKSEAQLLRKAYEIISYIRLKQPERKIDASNAIQKVWTEQNQFNNNLIVIQKHIDKCLYFTE